MRSPSFLDPFKVQSQMMASLAAGSTALQTVLLMPIKMKPNKSANIRC